MRRLVLACITALTAVSCGTHPVANDLMLRFAVPGDALAAILNANADRRFTVYVLTDVLPPEVTAQADTATLYLGPQRFQGSKYPDDAGQAYFQFMVGNRCSLLLQGEAVPLTYELSGSEGRVLATRTVTIPHIQPC
ncbi:hypothetical protein [uncultured Deinococcus sp.]|uniref:hypothetical protein n=1 Tax=uncultured Deinococcus sp. TaxID=158789 RepID=UPI0025CC3F25|nr:hypothetical protein [uncultured Deinococcus sp.]